MVSHSFPTHEWIVILGCTWLPIGNLGTVKMQFSKKIQGVATEWQIIQPKCLTDSCMANNKNWSAFFMLSFQYMHMQKLNASKIKVWQQWVFYLLVIASILQNYFQILRIACLMQCLVHALLRTKWIYNEYRGIRYNHKFHPHERINMFHLWKLEPSDVLVSTYWKSDVFNI